MTTFPLPPGKPALYPNSNGGFTAPTLSNWQFQYNGLTMGASQAVRVTGVEGLGGLGPIGSQDQALPRGTGEYAGVDAMGGRDPVLDLLVKSSLSTEMSSVGSALTSIPFSVLPLWFQVPGLSVLCSMCRPRQRSSPWDVLTAASILWKPTVTFHANDPRLYEEGQVSSCPSSGSSSVSWSVTNAGNTEMRPCLVLTGPLSAPAVHNTSIAGSPGIVFQSGVSIASGDQVVVDLDPFHLVTYYVGGIAAPSSRVPVYNWLDFQNTTWWNLLSGANSLTATVGSGSISAAAFQVWFASAHML